MHNRVLVFIPTYNCENQIGRVLAQFDQRALAVFDEILVIDNRSSDNTVKVAMEFAKARPQMPIRVAKNDENFGLGGSHKSAFSYALQNEFDFLVVLHGDDQGNISDMVRVIEQKKHLVHDVVLGSRFARGSSVPGYSSIRILGNRVFNLCFSLLNFRSITDLGAGLNLYRTDTLRDPYYLKFADDLTFNYYMILAHCSRQERIHFEPITWREEDQISNVRAFRQIGQILRIMGGFLIGRRWFLKLEHRPVSDRRYKYEILM